jgi:hypothetical protein
MKVLVCDDVADRGDVVVNAVRAAGHEPFSLIDGKLSIELKSLFGRVATAKLDAAAYKHEPSLFDDYDVVIIDNNLAYLDNAGGPPLTAESIAGYLRAFTEAAYIVSLNMNPDVDFDLRYLVGDFSTRADLAVNSSHLQNRSLWTHKREDSTNGFCPWYWPRLDSAAERRRAQVDFIKNHLDDPVYPTFDFDEEAVAFMSLHARGSLSPEGATAPTSQAGGKPLGEITFRDVFIAKDRSLPVKADRMTLDTAERNGSASMRDLIARVVAADVDLWFRRDIVGPQEALVDVPHLIVRFPFLLGSRAGDAQQWNDAVEAKTPPYGCEPVLYERHVAQRLFPHDMWTPTPCFWWPRLKSDEKLGEVFFQSKQQAWADVVFCEDDSRFTLRLGQDGGEPPVEFTAEFEGSWNRRYISRLNGVQYAPRSRLAV